jgi:hypothetical protein
MSQEKKDYIAATIKRGRDLVTSILGFHTDPEVVILVKKHEGIFSRTGYYLFPMPRIPVVFP